MRCNMPPGTVSAVRPAQRVTLPALKPAAFASLLLQNQWAPFYAERGCGQAKNVAAGQKLRDLVNAAPNARMQVGPA